MGIEQIIAVGFGALFLGLAVAMGRAFATARDRSVAVRARVTGFRTAQKRDSENRLKTYHYARFVVTGGEHDGLEGESPLGGGQPLYEVGDEVTARYDPVRGTITGDKGMRLMKIFIVLFTLVGAGIILAGLYLIG